MILYEDSSINSEGTDVRQFMGAKTINVLNRQTGLAVKIGLTWRV